MKTDDFILLFDMPLEKKSEARQIQRDLNRLGAKMLQQSVWKSKKLGELIKIATFIKNSGGQASILEEKLIF